MRICLLKKIGMEIKIRKDQGKDGSWAVLGCPLEPGSFWVS
jgi:hypothetical protein